MCIMEAASEVRMTARRQIRWRSFFAVTCLLALVLLYAPLGAAAWSSYKAACCTSGQCPIPEHHHKSPAAPANHMDCGHDMHGVPGMTSCAMSCCQDSHRPAVASAIFVLPVPATFSAPSTLPTTIISSRFPDLLRSIEPLSPPPRLTAA